MDTNKVVDFYLADSSLQSEWQNLCLEGVYNGAEQPPHFIPISHLL